MELFSFLFGVLISTILLPILVILIVSIRRMILDGSQIPGISQKYVLITGCDSGFGNLLARQLDKLGCHVLATCLTESGMGKLRTVLSSRATVLLMDVTKAESIKKAEETVRGILPTPDALWGIVNNAGTQRNAGAFDFETIENLKFVSEVNLWGTVAVTKAFLPHLKRSKGRLVNVASIGSRVSTPGYVSYSISKYGVAAFTDSIRLEMMPFDVSIHMLEPGGFATDLISQDKIRGEVAHFWKETPEDVKTDYDEDWHKNRIWYFEACKNTSGKLHKVTDCMEHALFSTKPKLRYFPGYDASFLWWFPLLPADITDIVLGFVHRRTRPLKQTDN